MRPDVAPLGTLMFPHRLAGSALRLTRTPIRNACRAGYAVSSFGPLYRVLAPFQCPLKARHGCPGHSPGTSAAVGPPTEAGVIGVDLRDLAPVGAVRGNPCGQLHPQRQLHA